MEFVPSEAEERNLVEFRPKVRSSELLSGQWRNFYRRFVLRAG